MKYMNYFILLRKSILFILTFTGMFMNESEAQIVPSKSSNNSKIRILSYNIRIAHPPAKGWEEVDLPAIARVINDVKPDLVALQEVDVFTERSGKAIHQAKKLSELTGMKYFFAKAVDRSGGDYGVAILSKYPIIDAKEYRLPVRDSVESEIRALGLIRVKLPYGEEIIFGSTHLDHLSDKDRLMQVKAVLGVVDKYSSYPVIIGADLNMEPDNPVMDFIRTKLNLACSECPLTFPAVNPKRTIDYFMLNKRASTKFEIISYKTINERYASDHLPLEAVLSEKN